MLIFLATQTLISNIIPINKCSFIKRLALPFTIQSKMLWHQKPLLPVATFQITSKSLSRQTTFPIHAVSSVQSQSTRISLLERLAVVSLALPPRKKPLTWHPWKCDTTKNGTFPPKKRTNIHFAQQLNTPNFCSAWQWRWRRRQHFLLGYPSRVFQCRRN